MRDPREIRPSDTCSRCGLRKATQELEQRGIVMRLCDDCYWGKESADKIRDDSTPAA